MSTDGIPRDYRPTVKVILVGNSGVGKTCLIGAYLKGSFEGRTAPTVAPAYSCREIKKSDGTIVILQIWDTAGQERYSSISQLFFRDSQVALVCCDPADESSVASVKDWVKRILNEVSDCHLFGVFTKSDLVPADQKDDLFKSTQGALGEVNFEQFFWTSSLTRDGVEGVFQAAAELYTRKGSQSAGQNLDEQGGKGCC
jgi:small GTP-binding protein